MFYFNRNTRPNAFVRSAFSWKTRKKTNKPRHQKHRKERKEKEKKKQTKRQIKWTLFYDFPLCRFRTMCCCCVVVVAFSKRSRLMKKKRTFSRQCLHLNRRITNKSVNKMSILYRLISVINVFLSSFLSFF